MEATPKNQPQIDWAAMLESALTIPGNIGNSFCRFHNYSFGNVVLLVMQGVEPQPVATYKRWQELGRHVVKGAKAKEIIRPITVKLKDQFDDEGNQKTIVRFKPVRAIFPLCDTAGDDLPPAPAVPGWSLDQAMKNLNISEVPFRDFDGNTAGYSFGRNLAINPVAPHPVSTYLHEMSHIEAGHTSKLEERSYETHRGVMEFEAEGSAYLIGNELEQLPEDVATVSRGYLQGWLRGQAPPERSIRHVFTTTTSILAAGRLADAQRGAGDAA